MAGAIGGVRSLKGAEWFGFDYLAVCFLLKGAS